MSRSTTNPRRVLFGDRAAAVGGVAVAVACVLGAYQSIAADGVLPLSVPVKVFPQSGGNATAESMPGIVTARPRPQPTLPGAKLPQYQFGHHHRRIPSGAELKDPRIRLILALPAMPILVDATITIDGQPYLMARENRIARIIEEALRPEPPAAEAPADPDTPDTSVAANPDGADRSSSSQQSGDADEEESSESRNAESAPSTENPEEEPEPEPVSPPTVPAYRLPANVPERIRRYIAAKGESVTADEVRWLLTNWVDGPVLLMLSDNFQRFRANQRPVFNVLDINSDGIISSDEVSGAVTAFEKCDFNRNDIVEYTELARVATDPRLRESRHAGPGKLIFRIPDERSAIATYRRIAERYTSGQPGSAPLLPRFDANSNGQFDPEELAVLNAAQPDLSFTITFNTEDPTGSRIELTDAGQEVAASDSLEQAVPNSISLPIGGTTVIFSAVQGPSSDQISIGAVNDGYPMLPVLDPNEDGRFTIRERRSLVNRLQTFDRNLDGSLTDDETQATIRICFGLGPFVHRELIELRQVNPNRETPVVVGPDWFVRMDRNGDNDVSRNEFPGRAEQFQILDADHDELISAQEALNFDAKNSRSVTEPATSPDSPADGTEQETATETGSSI